MNRLWNDLRYAVRQLRRAPGFSATAVITLAIGLGASSAIFCLLDGLWLQPMPVPHSGRLTRVFSTTAQDQEGDFSYPEYQALVGARGGVSGLIGGPRRRRRTRLPAGAPRWHFHLAVEQCGLLELLQRAWCAPVPGPRLYAVRC